MDPLVLYLLCLCCILWSLKYFLKYYNYLKLILKVPRVEGQLPFLGFGFTFVGADKNRDDRIFYFLQHLVNIKCFAGFYESMKSCLKPGKSSPRATWVALSFSVVINDIDQVQQVLASKDCLLRPWYVSVLPFPKGILFESGESWKKHRKIVQPAFNNSVLRTFLATFNLTAKSVIQKLRKMPLQQDVDIHAAMLPMILENILKTTGLAHNVDDEKISEYLHHFEK